MCKSGYDVLIFAMVTLKWVEVSVVVGGSVSCSGWLLESGQCFHGKCI